MIRTHIAWPLWEHCRRTVQQITGLNRWFWNTSFIIFSLFKNILTLHDKDFLNIKLCILIIVCALWILLYRFIKIHLVYTKQNKEKAMESTKLYDFTVPCGYKHEVYITKHLIRLIPSFTFKLFQIQTPTLKTKGGLNRWQIFNLDIFLCIRAKTDQFPLTRVNGTIKTPQCEEVNQCTLNHVLFPDILQAPSVPQVLSILSLLFHTYCITKYLLSSSKSLLVTFIYFFLEVTCWQPQCLYYVYNMMAYS